MSKNDTKRFVEYAATTFCDLFQVANSMEREKVSDKGVTRLQGYAVMHLYHEGGSSLQELAAKHRLASSTMSRVMDKLVDRGIVDREFDSIDRRRMLFRLSSAGMELAQSLNCCYEDLYKVLLDTIPAEDRENFLSNLGRVLSKMQETYMECCQCCKQTSKIPTNK